MNNLNADTNERLESFEKLYQVHENSFQQLSGLVEPHVKDKIGPCDQYMLGTINNKIDEKLSQQENRTGQLIAQRFDEEVDARFVVRINALIDTKLRLRDEQMAQIVRIQLDVELDQRLANRINVLVDEKVGDRNKLLDQQLLNAAQSLQNTDA